MNPLHLDVEGHFPDDCQVPHQGRCDWLAVGAQHPHGVVENVDDVLAGGERHFEPGSRAEAEEVDGQENGNPVKPLTGVGGCRRGCGGGVVLTRFAHEINVPRLRQGAKSIKQAEASSGVMTGEVRSGDVRGET